MAVDRERLLALAAEAAAFLPDVARLFRDVARDDRVPRRVKVEVGLAAAYLVLPFDVIPDFIPGLGQLDDLAIVGWAVRRLLLGAGEPLLREHWRGTDRGLEVLLQVASFGLNPRRLLAGLALGGLAGRPGADGGRVVDGEVVGERPATPPRH